MLILTRAPGQRIRIGDDIWVSVEFITSKSVKLGIKAPKHIQILREEITEVATMWGKVEIQKEDNNGIS